MFTHPSKSYLIFEGRLTKADNIAYANTDEIALTNNVLIHLFSRIEYNPLLISDDTKQHYC